MIRSQREEQDMPDAPHCLILGSDGMVGSALLARLRRDGVDAVGASRSPLKAAGSVSLNLTDDPQSWSIPAAANVVVNCAATANLAACEREPEESRKVNVNAVVALAQRCARESRLFIHLSSDRVFSGFTALTRDDAPFAPTSEYGRQKADADRSLLDLLAKGADIAIVRFTKIVSRTNSLFETWRNSLRRGETIRPFEDMRLAPVSLDFAIELLWRVIIGRRTGVFQASAETDVSYADFARDLAEACRAPPELVVPISNAAAGSDSPASPQYTSLDTSRIRNEMNLTPPATKEVAQWVASPSGCGREIDLMDRYPRSKRPIDERAALITDEHRRVARQFGRDFFDGDRLFGYGGYNYHPRFWQETVRRIRDYYQLPDDASILDVGSGKGFMLHDFQELMPKARLAGIDVSQYAYDNAMPSVKPLLQLGCAAELTFEDNSFDLVISINTVHNLPRAGCEQALREIQRVSRGRAFVTVDAWRTEAERERLLKWILTAQTYMHVDDWKRMFADVGYSGDYYWFIAE